MWLTTAITLAGASLLSKGYWNTFQVELKEIHIQPNSFASFEQPLNILHLTDIHVEKLSVKPERVRKLIKGYPIDLIALTGDYMDKVRSIDLFLHFLDELVQIPTRYGIYAVWGNHDWCLKDQLPRLKQQMEKRGVHVLCNESTTVKHETTPIHIIGVDDHFSGHSNIKQSFENVPDDDGYRLVLTHDPLITKQELPQFDYLLCGHLHSGQIYYPLPLHALTWGIRPWRKHLSGLKTYKQGFVYISGGLGQTGANLRLGCRPEVTLHTIGSQTEFVQEVNPRPSFAKGESESLSV